ncbi:hypothetical protein Acid345_3077 [Candidatus Koribacter versatilis Ellin345]|uniref:DUF6438 domain-containing protein n=1 Tax=Koribacter versatilis (strain Ellin345) TaxID=204669 RepID=Q1IM22_KORVE|nr:hypothetical protein Acid345_3077 [Candidatus Koribacter versatilis Ellin345]
MQRQFVCSAFLLALLCLGSVWGQDTAPTGDFLVKLERTGCVGACPGYVVTIDGVGRVRYEGKYYVVAEGEREKTVSAQVVKKLMMRLKAENFFDWPEERNVCVDYPEVRISVTIGARLHEVLEGCNRPGRVLSLAKEIDTITGTREWVQKSNSK